MTRAAAINECIDLVIRYREQWDHHMDMWTRGEGHINESLLMTNKHGVQILRRFDEL